MCLLIQSPSTFNSSLSTCHRCSGPKWISWPERWHSSAGECLPVLCVCVPCTTSHLLSLSSNIFVSPLSVQSFLHSTGHTRGDFESRTDLVFTQRYYLIFPKPLILNQHPHINSEPKKFNICRKKRFHVTFRLRTCRLVLLLLLSLSPLTRLCPFAEALAHYALILLDSFIIEKSVRMA